MSDVFNIAYVPLGLCGFQSSSWSSNRVSEGSGTQKKKLVNNIFNNVDAS